MSITEVRNSALFRLTQTRLNHEEHFSATQAEMDNNLTRIMSEAGNATTLIPLLMGTGASRLARTGILALGGNTTGIMAHALQGAAAIGGLGAEVVAYEGANRALTTFSGRTVPNLWKWQGEGGLRQGLFTSGITFTTLRGAGRAAAGQNIVFQHTAQSLAMVAGHNVAGAFELIPSPRGSLTEQFAHAEMTNIELSATMGAFHTAAPGFHAFERSLDLANQSRMISRLDSSREGRNLFLHPTAEAVIGNGRPRPFELKHPSQQPSPERPLILLSVMDGDGSNASRPEGIESLTTRRLEDGSLEMQATERGTKVRIEGLDLPSHEEGLRRLATRFPQGTSAVISALRELGWGPLWVRNRSGEPTEFRIILPHSPEKNGSSQAHQSGINELGIGPPTPLERNLEEGFSVVPESMDLAIRRLIDEIPGGPGVAHRLDHRLGVAHLLLFQGSLRHRRLEALQRLLSQGRNPSEVKTIENGSGAVPNLSASLAQIGFPVLIKEPNRRDLLSHRRALRGMTSDEDLSRIHHIWPANIDQPTPADIVYWPHPHPYKLERPLENPIGEYFGRDVKEGGYLVLQIDHLPDFHELYRHLDLSPSQWEMIFHDSLPNLPNQLNTVLPTVHDEDIHFQVLRRKSATPSTTQGHLTTPSTARQQLATPSTSQEASVSFPYLTLASGIYRLAKPSNVVVLKDVGGMRTLELVHDGHAVLHIESDPILLASAKNRMRALTSVIPGAPNSRVSFLNLDWYEVRAMAHHVEAFYPFGHRDLHLGRPHRIELIRNFLENGLNTKTKPDGSGFVVSEIPEFIDSLAQLISQDPQLKLLEVRLHQAGPPLRGGFGNNLSYNLLPHSWLVYRKIPPAP